MINLNEGIHNIGSRYLSEKSSKTSLEFSLRRGREHAISFKEEGLHEKCAVFGVFLSNSQAAPLVYKGLLRQQHRGQDSTGIVSFQAEEMFSRKSEGRVKQVYTDESISSLAGNVAIGHNRYGTSGGAGHIQPVTSSDQRIALAHNGTLPRVKDLEHFLRKKSIDISDLNDSELMQRAVEYLVIKEGLSIENAIKKAYPLFTGAFSLVVATEGKLIGLRDKFGIRPLSIGKIGDNGFVLSSETVGLDAVNATFFDEVHPGEMVVISENGLQRQQLVKGESKIDAFEFVYFSNKESVIKGIKVEKARHNMGKQLAQEQMKLPEGKRVHADIVIPVPQTSNSYSEGFSPEFGIPSINGLLIKDPERTFIHASGERSEKVRNKFQVDKELVKGKRVILLDDSIVRGTTAKELVKMMREAGATEVHLFSASPPVKFGDFYGIDLPSLFELVANRFKGEKKLKQYFDSDSVRYLSLKGMVNGIGLPMEQLCLSVFNGEYPIPIGAANRRSMRQAA